VEDAMSSVDLFHAWDIVITAREPGAQPNNRANSQLHWPPRSKPAASPARRSGAARRPRDQAFNDGRFSVSPVEVASLIDDVRRAYAAEKAAATITTPALARAHAAGVVMTADLRRS
jgi:hypothetical protein